jgi:chromosomal replication initiation ATPase DnaA
VRELQGALNRLVAHQSLMGDTITIADVWQILGAARIADAPDEFESFLQDIAEGVAASVDSWRLRLGERIAYWSGQGFRTTILEQALDLEEAPDVEQLDASFAAVTERLRTLEAAAIALDPSLAGLPVFHDPDRLTEAERLLARAMAVAHPPPRPAPGISLSTLVRAPGNQLALRAAASVIEAPGGPYNPLVLVGPAGAGKTHLAHAIGNGLARREVAQWSVGCIAGQAFVDELGDALEQDRLEHWRARYRAVDALIVDGIQAIDGRERVQEELFYLFNVLHREGRQLVLTSDRPLDAYIGLAERLRTRFEGGLVVTVTPPNAGDRSGRNSPVPTGDEAAAPTLDGDAMASLLEPVPFATGGTPDVAPVTAPRRALDSFFFDSEKIVAEWPEPTGRLIEDLG